jgi:uncharacterized protein YkwD
MRSVFVALLLAAACGQAGETGDGGSTAERDGEPADLRGITAAHNRTRDQVGVAALVWNDDLEALAAAFVADCVFEHSSLAERSDVAGFDYVGENLYRSQGFQPTGEQVSDAWASERVDYDHATNSCASKCGHYTQQVWRTTTDLGCAMQSCPDTSFVLSCEYGPGGNYEGQRPY